MAHKLLVLIGVSLMVCHSVFYSARSGDNLIVVCSGPRQSKFKLCSLHYRTQKSRALLTSIPSYYQLQGVNNSEGQHWNISQQIKILVFILLTVYLIYGWLIASKVKLI